MSEVLALEPIAIGLYESHVRRQTAYRIAGITKTSSIAPAYADMCQAFPSWEHLGREERQVWRGKALQIYREAREDYYVG